MGGTMDGANEITARPTAGDPIPPKCSLIEVRVAELKQLFNAIDPSPFREKDLDPKADEFIVGWARDYPDEAQLALLVHLDRPAGRPDEAPMLRDAVHEYFSQKAIATRRHLRDLFRRGRRSLLIGLAFLAALLLLGDLLAARLHGSMVDVLRESLLIGGWVAMWRPLEIFLYDWWPLRREARLDERLAAMPVRIRYANEKPPEAWRSDWPAVTPRGERHLAG